MNYDQAKAIITELAPDLIVDPINPCIPHMFVVRRAPTGTPFSIHLEERRLEDFPPIAAQDAVPAQDAIPATADHPGMPAIAARPAVIARTSAGQLAEAERKSFELSLAAARKFL